jgi:hypothetical protein
MSSEELPQDFVSKLKEVIGLCEKYNIRPMNLDNRELAPDDAQESYDELIEIIDGYNEISRVKVLRWLGENVSLDPERETQYYLWDIAVRERNDLVPENYPNLCSFNDSDLIEIPQDADMNKNGFEYQEHYLIFLDRLAQNYYLTEKLATLRSPEVSLSIPISYNKLGMPDTTREMFLAAHWRGPETIDELRDRSGSEFFIQKGTESYQYGLQDRTEFYFELRDEEWHLQIEELLPRTGIFYSPHTDYRSSEIKYYTRYFHAILDDDCKRCYHMDGAVRGYGSLEQFIERHTERELQDPNILKRMSTRHKLFKADSPGGEIDDFGEVAGLFFKHNPHIQRFFEGDSEYARELEERRATHFQFDFDSDRVQKTIGA